MNSLETLLVQVANWRRVADAINEALGPRHPQGISARRMMQSASYRGGVTDVLDLVERALGKEPPDTPLPHRATKKFTTVKVR